MYDLNLAMRIKNKVEKHVIRIKTYHIQQITHEKISQFRFAESSTINPKQNKFVFMARNYGHARFAHVSDFSDNGGPMAYVYS